MRPVVALNMTDETNAALICRPPLQGQPCKAGPHAQVAAIETLERLVGAVDRLELDEDLALLRVVSAVTWAIERTVESLSRKMSATGPYLASHSALTSSRRSLSQLGSVSSRASNRLSSLRYSDLAVGTLTRKLRDQMVQLARRTHVCAWTGAGAVVTGMSVLARRCIRSKREIWLV